ncbi:T9SS type A sorting domain-containing protein [Flavobacterium sp.]|uniref:T9SS type A sorting domain-containing protein n=1 Tax=Flavobacterium sp. TaxID=239 RepID=UPI002489589B|nr:T9SS type A sorting domain-containing protein [Flavobacterium sp.]MDI1316131.1 T9SS type A sorting domain-containing protein [Flavobacterium sp.]
MKKTIIVFILILQNSFAQNGILDSSFGSGGLKTFSLGNRNARGNHLITFSDNSFIVAGNSDGVTYAPNTERGFFITKYLSSGDLDTSFGTNGVISIEGTLTGQTFLTSAIKCNDGKVLLVCKINGTSKFIKINPIIGYDSQFGNNGFVDLPVNTLPGILSEFNNGKFISINGTYNGNSNTYFFNRYNADGSIDLSFGNNGGLISDITSFSYDYCQAIKILPNNKFFTVGSSSNSVGNYFTGHICKFNEDGTLDTTFGNNGVVLTQIGVSPGYAQYRNLDLLNNGKIVVCGSSEYSGGTGGFGGSKPLIVKYNSDGTLDNTFGTNGIVVLDVMFNGNDNFYSVKVQSDNKFLGIGSSAYPYPFMKTFLNISRLLENGTLDNTFGNNGVFLTDNNTSQLNNGWKIEIQNDTKIIALGSTTTGESTIKNTLICRFDFENSLNINQNSSENDLIIYPNPTVNKVYLKGVASINNLEIYNILGQSFNVLKKEISNNELEIDISKLSQGTYIFKIETDSKIAIKKVIIE